MRKALLLVLPLLFLSVSLLANEQTRREKREEIRAERLAAKTIAPAKVQGTNAGWVTFDLENAAHTYKSVHVTPDGAIWMTGYNNANDDDVVWLSLNNGASWAKKVIPSGPNGTVFAARDANIAVAADFAGRIHYTSNGGTTWSTAFEYSYGDLGFFDYVRYLDSNTVIALGDADENGLCVAKSTDGGATWVRLTNLPAEEASPEKWFSYATYHSAGDVYNGIFWCSLYTGAGTWPRILKTTDAGATWTAWEITLTGTASTNYYLRSLQMVDENVGYAVDRASGGFNNWMHKTTDGGLTWSDTISFQPGVAHNAQRPTTIVPLRGTNTVLALGFSTIAPAVAKSWWSTDAGATWTDIPASGVDFLNGAFVDATTFWAAGTTNFARFTPTRDTRKVTFTVNTATVPDTLPVVGQTMQIRGGVNHAGGVSPITWGNDAQNNLTRVGGDYWSKSMTLQVGDTLRYKYVVTYPGGTGWEQSVVPAGPVSGGDRVYIVADKDTTLDVEFWNNGPNTNAQYFRPWTAVADNFMNVYFRVNMSGPMVNGTFNFNANTDTVGVRGGTSNGTGGDLNWSPTFYLTKETEPSNQPWPGTIPANTFWSGRVRLHKDSIAEGQEMQYKFLIGYDWGRDELQGGKPNRTFRIPAGKKDTTLSWVFFDNQRPAGRPNADTMIITFRTNLAKAASSGGFTVGSDTIEVQTGWFGTAAESPRPRRLQQVIGSIYQVTDTIVTSRDKLFDYQYYVYRNGQTVRENYYNFTYSGPLPTEAERRQVLIPTTGTAITILDTATSVTQDRRQPQFPNGRNLSQDVLVTWTVDLRPAIFQVLKGDTLNDIQGTFHVTPADVNSILGWGVWINGPATGGWTGWGSTLNTTDTKKMYDDGTNGDLVAGDSIFTRQILASPDSVLSGSKSLVGQVFKYGIRGGDNEGGKGGFGNNHNENIVDTAPTYTLETQFGSINPAFYDAWDFDTGTPITGVIDENQPLLFSLAQNYPNPFNPSTRIEYSIPNQSKVVLKVYNLVGQEVATLVNDVLPAGVHSVRFDANKLATGFYVYRLSAGDFTSVKKMLLLK